MVSEVSAGGPLPALSRQARTLIAVSMAHCVSHIHILTLPPLFLLLTQEMNVGYLELGLSVTVFGVVSGLTQAPMGYVVDRFGARRILIAGLCLGGAAFIALGFYLSYPALLVTAAVAGLANCVYHPADYAILSAAMDDRRMGRAFSVHTCAGMAGGALAPAIGLGIAVNFGVSWALFVLGGLGPLAALLIVLLRVPDSPSGRSQGAASDGAPKTKQRMLTPAILALVVFFILLSLSNGGLTTFGIAAMRAGYGVSLEWASLALSLFLGATAIGVLVGGVLADRTSNHGLVAAICFGINAVIFALIAYAMPTPPVLIFALTTAGLLSGLISPSRDMLVRKAAPVGAAGRAFGIVSTGFNIGAIIGPMLFGYIMDQDAPRMLFAASAVFMTMTVLLAIWTDAKSNR